MAEGMKLLLERPFLQTRDLYLHLDESKEFRGWLRSSAVVSALRVMAESMTTGRLGVGRSIILEACV